MDNDYLSILVSSMILIGIVIIIHIIGNGFCALIIHLIDFIIRKIF